MKKYFIVTLILLCLLSFSCFASEDSYILSGSFTFNEDADFSHVAGESYYTFDYEFRCPSFSDELLAGFVIEDQELYFYGLDKYSIFVSGNWVEMSPTITLVEDVSVSEEVYNWFLFNTSLGSNSSPSFTPSVPTYDLKPLSDSINQDLSILVPIGIVLLGLFLSVGLIPRIIYKFL